MQHLTVIGDHPLDIFRFGLAQMHQGYDIVLVIITAITGSSPRQIGAPMIVSSNGDYAGYVSSGCIDGDIAMQALEALEHGDICYVRYGDGSPYMDIHLPCGGGLEVVIVPRPEPYILQNLCQQLEQRSMAYFNLGDMQVSYAPPLRLVIYGSGVECERLTNLAHICGFITEVEPGLSDLQLDPWSAVVLLYHDHEREIPVFQAILDREAFYIGAMGSRQTHQKRIEQLRASGISQAMIKRIKGPIGLVPSTRDAGRLAVSILAEIFDIERQFARLQAAELVSDQNSEPSQ